MPAADRSSTPDLVRDDSGSVRLGFGSTGSMAPSFVSMRAKTPTQPPSTHRSTSAPIVNSPAPPSRTDSTSSIVTNGLDGKHRGSSTTVSSFAYGKAWEVEAEAALRDIYTNVRADRILLPISGSASTNNRQSMISINSTGPYDSRSKTVRSPSDRVNALKRGSIRGVQGLLNNPYGSQWSTSDGRLSPTPSYATSINEVSRVLGADGVYMLTSSRALDPSHQPSVSLRISLTPSFGNMTMNCEALIPVPASVRWKTWKTTSLLCLVHHGLKRVFYRENCIGRR